MWEKRDGRFVRSAAFVLGVAVLGMLTLLSSAAATPQPTSTVTTTAAPDLSTVPKIVSYLGSIGVDRTEIVIQRGARNYAGPNCPGMTWHCTRAAGIVIQAAESGANKFECSPSEDTGPFGCTVFQSSVNGNNMATCRESTSVTPAVLTCAVFQSNVNGSNHANIDQTVDQRVGAMQSAMVSAELEQDNESGSNHANLSQSISQSTSQVSGTTQSQDADFDANVDQDTDDGGNNFLTQSQTLTQTGTASGSSVSQSQTADHFGDVDQDALEGGEAALAVLSVGLQTASEDGFSKATVRQTERQTLEGNGSQDQFGPMNCCGAGSQEGSPTQTHFNIHQDSSQKASQANAEQSSHLDGSCFSSGTCSIDHKANNDEDKITVHASVDGEPLFVHTRCESTEFWGEGSGECTSSTTDTDPHGD